MNEQKPVPQVAFNGSYSVHSIFHTIQGEGPFSGDAAVFVRLAGCNLQCPMCDTDYTSGERAARMTATEICYQVIRLVRESATRLVVITGGEPFRQDVFELTDTLIAHGYNVQFETNGVLAPSDFFKTAFATTWLKPACGVAIVVSPKASYVDEWISLNSICYKYVLSHDSLADDGLPIEVLGRKSSQVARPLLTSVQIYVSPADPVMLDSSSAALQREANMRACVDSVQKHGYRMQLQIHKYLGVE